jgi:RpiB/LacA/LacB family sugar-phosphate isomerase
MRFEIGSDHRGFELKTRIISWLAERGHAVNDRGCNSGESCDYPDFGFGVARAVAASPGTQGILICSNGIGMSMAANKVPGVRAALCLTPAMASQARRHNDANVLVLGADNVPYAESLAIVSAWLGAAFEGGRHERRVRKLAEGELARIADAATKSRRPEYGIELDCIFCKIASGKVPAEKVFEDDDVLGFRDIHPAAPTHVLLIPKVHIPTLNDLTPEHDRLLGRLVRAAGEVAAREGLAAGYRLVGNCGRGAGQEVFHIHFHLLGGRPLDWPPG